jgi:hypothetical protein
LELYLLTRGWELTYQKDTEKRSIALTTKCTKINSKFLLILRGKWRKLHNEELTDLYSSPTIVPVIKSRRMRWEGHATRMGVGRGVYWVLVGKPEG